MNTNKEKYFSKKTSLDPSIAEERYLKLNEISEKAKYFKVPKFIKKEGECLYFERISDFKNFNYFIKNKKNMKKSLYKLGIALGEMHRLFNKKEELNDIINLHGDFSLHNSLIIKETVYIIDFEPPHTSRQILGNDEYYIKNFKELDLARLLFKLRNHIFLSPKFFNKKFIANSLTKQFIEGYEIGSGSKINSHRLNHFMKKIEKEVLTRSREKEKFFRYIIREPIYQIQRNKILKIYKNKK